MTDSTWLNEAIRLRESGMSYNNIAKQLGKCKKTVSYRLQELGYKPKREYKNSIQNQPNKKYINENYFETIDTEHKAYWLGFMYADGYVGHDNRVELALKEEDYEHVLKFKNDLESEHKINKKTKKMNGKIFYSYKLSVIRKKLRQDLENKGCIPNKSKILKYPTIEQVPLDLQRHFIRGYIDGDGCISDPNNNRFILDIVGTEDFLNGINNYFELEPGQNIYSFKHSDVKHFSKGGKFAYDMMTHLYENATIYLKRKHERYLGFADLFRNE